MRSLLSLTLLSALALPGHAGSAGLAWSAEPRLGVSMVDTGTVARQGAASSPSVLATDSVWVFTNRQRQDGRWRTAQGDVRRLVRAFRVTPVRQDPVPYEVRLQVQAAGERLLEASDMRRAMTAALAQETDGAIVLHVHGYATSLDEAAEEAAEMRRRGGFGGPMAVFAWPAHSIGVTWPAPGRIFTNAYWRDSLAAEASVDDFVVVLHELVTLAGADRVVVSAHSMGNQLLANALQRPEVQALLGPAPLRALVFASPDVDRDWFHAAVIPTARLLAERLVLYGARDDHMLRISTLVHDGRPRAGLFDDAPWPVTPGLEIVDITDGRVAAPWLGSLFDTNHALRRHGTALADLFGNVATEAEPMARCAIGLVPLDAGESEPIASRPGAAGPASSAPSLVWRALPRAEPLTDC
jgi:esterase/lipase superfamily enzyme